MSHIVVTGTNRGIGAALVEYFKTKGESVIGTTRQDLELTSEKSIAAFAKRMDGTRIKVLINNAAIYRQPIKETLATNFFGVVRLTDALLPLIEPTGTVINVTSDLGSIARYPAEIKQRFLSARSRADLQALADDYLSGAFSHDPYGVSKALINAWSRVLAKEAAPIKVFAVSPGWVRTDMGGDNAPRTVEQGVASIVHPLTHDVESGGVYYDGAPLADE